MTQIGGNAPTGLKFKDLKINAYVTELSSESSLLLEQSLGDQHYNFSFTDYSSTQGVINSTSSSQVLPFRYSSLNKVIQIMRRQDTIAAGLDQLTISNRSKGKLEECWLDVGSTIIPQQKLKMSGITSDQMGEVWAETMVHVKRGLTDY